MKFLTCPFVLIECLLDRTHSIDRLDRNESITLITLPIKNSFSLQAAIEREFDI